LECQVILKPLRCLLNLIRKLPILLLNLIGKLALLSFGGSEDAYSGSYQCHHTTNDGWYYISHVALHQSIDNGRLLNIHEI